MVMLLWKWQKVEIFRLLIFIKFIFKIYTPWQEKEKTFAPTYPEEEEKFGQTSESLINGKKFNGKTFAFECLDYI